ncbi:MAG: cupredoxin domain-containing protein [Ktedonobacteraceae bacterium]
MAKKQLRALALLLAALAFGSIVLMACARPGAGTANATSTTGPSSAPTSAPTTTQPLSCPTGTTVKTGATTFEDACITLSKGSTLQIVQDVRSFHELDYGQWNGTSASPATPSSAPAMKDLQLSGASVSVGPFTTAGTYHIYCIVHPGMNLTVIVQ